VLSDASKNKKSSQGEEIKRQESDTNLRFKELTVKTKWNNSGSPETKGSLRVHNDQRLMKGVSFKEDSG